MDNKKVAIFVCSPNSYSDALKIFIECKNRNWPKCPYDFVLATNNQIYGDQIKVFNNFKENDGWTDRALPVIQSLNYKYLILFSDDAFISKSVDNHAVDYILDTMEEKQLQFCRLKHYKYGKEVDSNSQLAYLNKRTPYGLNLHKGIFRKDYLLSLLGDGTKSCWQLEKDWNLEASNAPNTFYSDLVACRTEVIPTMHGIEKGKWFPSTIRNLKKMGFASFGNREKMSFFREFAYILKTKLGDSLTPEMRLTIKKILKKLGMSFATED